MLGCFRARAVPFNVNQHYRRGEITALLADVGVRAVIYHRAYAPLVAAGCDLVRWCSSTSTTGRGSTRCPGSIAYEDAVSTPVGDDAAGAVPGRPLHGVHRRHDRASQGGALAPGRHLHLGHGRRGGCHGRVDRGGGGGMERRAVVRHASAHARRRAVDRVLRAPHRRHRPPARRLEALRCGGGARARRAGADLPHGDRRRRLRRPARRRAPPAHRTTCRACSSSAPAARPPASTTSRRSSSSCPTSRSGTATARRRPAGWPSAPAPARSATTASCRAAAGWSRRPTARGSSNPATTRSGWVARRGRVPLGYLGDRERTEATFPIVDGDRVAIPGDRGRLLADGSIELLGRDVDGGQQRRREGLRRGGRVKHVMKS